MGRSLTTAHTVYMLDFGLARQYVLNKSSNVNGANLEVRPPRAAAGYLNNDFPNDNLNNLFFFSFRFRGTVRYVAMFFCFVVLLLFICNL